MSKLVKIAGIAIAASRVKAKATHVTLVCKNCRKVRTVPCRPGLGGAIVPRSCDHVPQVRSSIMASGCLPGVYAGRLVQRVRNKNRENRFRLGSK
jgi:DNA replicative helicase MCM subunit Mcm2 (Cdc46/Mcm family)